MFFSDPATTGIYTLSLHDDLPIWVEDEVDEILDGWDDEEDDEGEWDDEDD